MIDSGYALAGAFTGFVVGLTGVGGGALMTPVLLLFFGVPPATAIGTDLWFAAITKIFGARVHHASGRVDWQVARRLWWGSLPTALAVPLLVGAAMPVARVDWLSRAVGVVVLITAAGLIVAPTLGRLARHRRELHPDHFKAMQPALTIISGSMLGVCVALTSVGAGALGSVMLTYLYPLRMTPHRLVATDIVHAIPLALVAGLGYLWMNLVDGAMLLSLLAGSLPMVVIGSRLSGKFTARRLQLALAAVLAATSAKVLL